MTWIYTNLDRQHKVVKTNSFYELCQNQVLELLLDYTFGTGRKCGERDAIISQYLFLVLGGEDCPVLMNEFPTLPTDQPFF